MDQPKLSASDRWRAAGGCWRLPQYGTEGGRQFVGHGFEYLRPARGWDYGRKEKVQEVRTIARRCVVLFIVLWMSRFCSEHFHHIFPNEFSILRTCLSPRGPRVIFCVCKESLCITHRQFCRTYFVDHQNIPLQSVPRLHPRHLGMALMHRSQWKLVMMVRGQWTLEISNGQRLQVGIACRLRLM